jgi:hypothetical protein
MTIGWAIFASTVLVLLVLNKPFRKFMAWFAGITAVLALVVGLGYYLWAKHADRIEAQQREAQAAAHQKLVDACMARFAQAENTADLITKVACEENPDAQPQPPAPKPDWRSGLLSEQPKKPPHLRHARATTDTEITTTQYGSLKCGTAKQGDVVTVLEEGVTEVKVRTMDGIVGWAHANAFEVVQ